MGQSAWEGQSAWQPCRPGRKSTARSAAHAAARPASGKTQRIPSHVPPAESAALFRPTGCPHPRAANCRKTGQNGGIRALGGQPGPAI